MLDALRARDVYLVAGCAAAGSVFLAAGTLTSDAALALLHPRTADRHAHLRCPAAPSQRGRRGRRPGDRVRDEMLHELSGVRGVPTGKGLRKRSGASAGTAHPRHPDLLRGECRHGVRACPSDQADDRHVPAGSGIAAPPRLHHVPRGDTAAYLAVIRVVGVGGVVTGGVTNLPRVDAVEAGQHAGTSAQARVAFGTLQRVDAVEARHWRLRPARPRQAESPLAPKAEAHAALWARGSREDFPRRCP